MLFFVFSQQVYRNRGYFRRNNTICQSKISDSFFGFIRSGEKTDTQQAMLAAKKASL